MGGPGPKEVDVPLSEEELRLLEQMERALVAEDPKLASTLRGTQVRKRQRRQLALGIVVFVVGVAVLMSGAVLSLAWLGVIGFVVMLGAVVFSLNAWRGRPAPPSPSAPGSNPEAPGGLHVIDGGKARRRRSRPQPSNDSLMYRFEERWRRRREGDR
jgi:hypothetical protein